MNGKRKFPCPICTQPCEVRITKKHKPYIVCDPCGLQLFVRGPHGIAAFERLLDRDGVADLWTRIEEMQRRFYFKCPACGCRFWIEPNLVKTSPITGSLQGFRCPGKNCQEVVPWKTKE